MPRSAVLFASAAMLLPIQHPRAALAMDGVVASIKPVHSLVAGVMAGVAEPELLVEGAASPHVYAMRPSDAARLEDAALVFWIGAGMETFLADALGTLATDARTVALEDAPGLSFLAYREGGAFAAHDPEAHGDDDPHHEEHAGDAAEANADAAPEQSAAPHVHGEDHAPGDDHDHAGYDLHLWLDPDNAKAMVAAIEEALAAADPDNAAAYAENAEALTARLDDLTAEIAAKLVPVADRSFVVFHDAYHYFENRFGLQAAGTITISPEIAPGAQRVTEIQQRLATLDAACVFAEPQFEPRIVDIVTEGTSARAGTLDPLGADLEDGPELYFDLMRGMATSFADCLSPED